MNRELLFSVTAADCEWEYFRGSGKGGQKRNKTSNACRCRHRPSEAVGTAQDGRSQRQNRVAAFRRMSETPEFRRWHRVEVSRRIGRPEPTQQPIEEWLAEQTSPENIRVEYYDPKVGKGQKS